MATTRKSEATRSRDGQNGAQPRTFQTRHDLEEEVRGQMIELLNQ